MIDAQGIAQLAKKFWEAIEKACAHMRVLAGHLDINTKKFLQFVDEM